jgi:hypothetical protein
MSDEPVSALEYAHGSLIRLASDAAQISQRPLYTPTFHRDVRMALNRALAVLDRLDSMTGEHARTD